MKKSICNRIGLGLCAVVLLYGAAVAQGQSATHPAAATKAAHPAAAHPAVTHPAGSSVHLYRYSLSTKIGNSEYHERLVGSQSLTGPYYKVETDKLGRIVRATYMRSGKEVSAVQHLYHGNEKLPYRNKSYVSGELTSIDLITRNESGLAIRAEQQTAQGVMTAYSVTKELPEYTDTTSYDAHDVMTNRDLDYYSPSGIVVREISYLSSTFNLPLDQAKYVDLLLDEHTGLSLSRKQFEAGKLTVSRKYTYTADGDLTRIDIYRGESNDWFGAIEYADGLSTKKLYKFTDGSTKEMRYSYDAKRWMTKTEVYASDKFICTLTYDRLPDGTVKRTLALGPDGSLWAEYPVPSVLDIDNTGQAVNRTDAILHHTGNWW